MSGPVGWSHGDTEVDKIQWLLLRSIQSGGKATSYSRGQQEKKYPGRHVSKSGTINPNHMAQGGLDSNGSEEDSTESLSRTQRFEWQIQGGRGVPCDTCGAERGTVGDEAGAGKAASNQPGPSASVCAPSGPHAFLGASLSSLLRPPLQPREADLPRLHPQGSSSSFWLGDVNTNQRWEKSKSRYLSPGSLPDMLILLGRHFLQPRLLLSLPLVTVPSSSFGLRTSPPLLRTPVGRSLPPPPVSSLTPVCISVWPPFANSPPLPHWRVTCQTRSLDRTCSAQHLPHSPQCHQQLQIPQ